MSFNLLLTDQSDNPVTTADFGSIERGSDSANVLHLKLKNTGSDPANNIVFGLEQQNPTTPTEFDSSGLPVLDEEWGQLQITGIDDSGTSGQQTGLPSWQTVGAFQLAMFPPILAGNFILFDLKLTQPTTSSEIGAQTLKILIGQSTATAIPPGFSAAASGVISGIGASRSFPIEGLAVTATGTPDDYVHSAIGRWLTLGTEYNDDTVQDSQLDQNDGGSSALTTGQAYIAVLSRGASGLNVTKGTKGTTPAWPSAVPQGDALIAMVNVAYHSGASVIGTSDITDLRVFGRYLATLDGGLNLHVWPGESITADYWQHPTSPIPLSATDSSGNFIFIDKLGTITIQTSPAPPSAGALALWKATASGGSITDLVDLRTFVGAQSSGFNGQNGAGKRETSVAENLTLDTGAAHTDTAANLLLAGAKIDAIAWRILTTITTASSWGIGDGGSATRFASGIMDLTAGDHGLVLVPDTAAAQAAAAKLRATFNTTPGAGKIEFVVFQRIWIEPTA